VPMHDGALRPFTRAEAVELGRLVLLDRVKANAESWFVARCHRALRADFDAVVSFSDPEPRTTVDGAEVFRGHVGTVYQALGACYAGRATPRTHHLLPDGTVLCERALSKVRTRERGWEYAVAQLVAAGVEGPADDSREGLSAWLRDALARSTRTRRHRGNHRYLFALSRASAKALPTSLPYPKFDLFGRPS